MENGGSNYEVSLTDEKDEKNDQVAICDPITDCSAVKNYPNWLQCFCRPAEAGSSLD